MKILVDEMYDGYDEELNNHGGFEAQSVKKLVNKGEKLKSDFSVLNYAKKYDMILVTADVENQKGCDENGIKCVCPNKDTVFQTILSGLEKYKK